MLSVHRNVHMLSVHRNVHTLCVHARLCPCTGCPCTGCPRFGRFLPNAHLAKTRVFRDFDATNVCFLGQNTCFHVFCTTRVLDVLFTGQGVQHTHVHHLVHTVCVRRPMHTWCAHRDVHTLCVHRDVHMLSVHRDVHTLCVHRPCTC